MGQFLLYDKAIKTKEETKMKKMAKGVAEIVRRRDRETGVNLLDFLKLLPMVVGVVFLLVLFTKWLGFASAFAVVVIPILAIAAAACFLPLSENSSISRELGTRHRAALGISETTDALVLIVSEETGVISMAREGRLTRYLDGKALTNLLMSTFSPDAPTVKRVMVDGVKTILKRKEKQHEGEN